jgi:hypothetical protein
MAEATWNKPFNYYDTVQRALRDAGAPRSAMQEYLPFYGQLLSNAVLYANGLSTGNLGLVGALDAIPTHKQARMGVIEPIAELMWHTFNRPTWFCDNTMLELLRTAKIDDNLRDIHWPAESLYICFENGAKIGRFNLRSIAVFAPRSEITVNTVRKATRKAYLSLGDVHCDQIIGKLLGVWVDCLDGPDFVLRPDGYLKSRERLYVWRKYEEPIAPSPDENVNEDERAATVEAMHIAAAAMLYYSARPELVAPYSLPRSQRYSFIGGRDNYRRLTLPGGKVVRDPSRSDGTDTGSAKSPHYRGWVLRTLRDSRYKRKEDGTYRTVLIAPTAIHPELMGDNPER